MVPSYCVRTKPSTWRNCSWPGGCCLVASAAGAEMISTPGMPLDTSAFQ